ncbi:hypothetical protein HPB50_016474 [Hyalomma asiaticum]|uniref:Uncharacterized protein n=1 Tax=Hyalomma asiaticum TaxID=266040 RepID=A0ACB7RWX4_HYAAI|nr:hypothetical protein HPB50_016474 [Hyalomma asiaticum]
MCDYTFYTHVYYDTKDKKIHPKYGKTAYHVFKKGSSSYQVTTFGVSMKSGTIPAVIADNKQDLTDALRDMMKNKIMHFGMLDVDVRDYSAASKHMEFLKASCTQRPIFNDLSLKTVEEKPAGLPVCHDAHPQIHHYKSSNPDKLFPIAPNPVGGDLQKYDVTTFNDIKDKLDELTADVAEQGHYLMISMAMYALAYRVPNYQQTLTLATSSVALDYGVVQDRLDVLPKNFSGIAAYNVEMDDFDQSCLESQDNGKAFYRLNLIRKKVNVAREHVVANVPTS